MVRCVRDEEDADVDRGSWKDFENALMVPEERLLERLRGLKRPSTKLAPPSSLPTSNVCLIIFHGVELASAVDDLASLKLGVSTTSRRG
mmetsp:Transcript_35340/g.79781  ORF Transcript_35340/g.79781 Transcript_35340/m.79781 type:complete len:89 (+) Transcript_35340:293-559(+)